MRGIRLYRREHTMLYMHRQCFENILYVQKETENSALQTQIHTVDYKNYTVDFVNHTADYKISTVDLSFQRTIFYSSMHNSSHFTGQFKTKNLILIINIVYFTDSLNSYRKVG